MVERWPSVPVIVTAGRTVLTPGASIAQLPTETALLAVEWGELTVQNESLIGPESGEAKASPVASRQQQQVCWIKTETVSTDGSACLPTGADVRLSNTSTQPAVILLLTIAPFDVSS
jgi:hypothetical protein